MAVVLPPLRQHASPNVSDRRMVPYLVVVHRPVGDFAGAERTLTSPAAQVSGHILTDSNRPARISPSDDDPAAIDVGFRRVA